MILSVTRNFVVNVVSWRVILVFDICDNKQNGQGCPLRPKAANPEKKVLPLFLHGLAALVEKLLRFSLIEIVDLSLAFLCCNPYTAYI